MHSIGVALGKVAERQRRERPAEWDQVVANRIRQMEDIKDIPPDPLIDSEVYEVDQLQLQCQFDDRGLLLCKLPERHSCDGTVHRRRRVSHITHVWYWAVYEWCPTHLAILEEQKEQKAVQQIKDEISAAKTTPTQQRWYEE